MKTLTIVFILISIFLYACKKGATQTSAGDTMINGKWKHIKNIDWYTNIPTSSTVKDTTTETHDVYIDFHADGKLYQKVWNVVTSVYVYDTSSFSVNGSSLTITGSHLTLTNPYQVDILTLSAGNLNLHTINIVGSYKDENWDYFIK